MSVSSSFRFPFPSALATTDHADRGVCGLHPTVPTGDGAPCIICTTGQLPRRSPTSIASDSDADGPLFLLVNGRDAQIFLGHGGVSTPTDPEPGDQANDHRDTK